MISDYFEYERRLWQDAMLPGLRALDLSFDGQRVLDIGCGHGGMLKGLTESFAILEAVGLDVDEAMIAGAQQRHMPRARFMAEDLFAFATAQAFDVVFLRDVLEHIIEPERAFARALELTRPGGIIYVSYAPFLGPFGGHQHNGSGLFSNLPWLHLLPEALFRRLIRVRGNAYKQADSLVADVETVLQTRLSLRRVERLLTHPEVRVLDRARYLVRPDYRIKFGLPVLVLPRLPTALAELLCTAEALVLRRR